MLKRKNRGKRVKRHNPANRLWVVSGITTLALAGLLLRLGYVQVKEGSQFRGESTNVQVVSYPVLPPRGFIYSSNGTVLAEDKPVYDAYLTRLPNVSENLQNMADKLAPWLGESPKAVLTAMKTSPLATQVLIKRNLSEAAVSYIYEHRSELPGVRVEVDPIRYYPYGDLAAHILGYVGPITSSSESYYNKLGYLDSQIVGETGVEAQYESYLQGHVGEEEDLVNSAGVPIKSIGMQPPAQSGDNLQLTIDSTYQALAQEIVANYIQNSPLKYEISEASAVVLNVKTGGVEAMVSYPYYNPNWFLNGNYLKHSTYLEKSDALINNVIQSPEYPGSTVKPANAIAGMQSGTITPNTIVYDHGFLQIGNRIFHNWYLPGFGPVNVTQAIELSDDTFFYQLGLWLGGWNNNTGYPNGESYNQWVKTRFVKALNTLFGWEYRFGLGAMTGIDLPGEVPGMFWEEDTQQNYLEVPYDLKQAEASLKKKGYYDNWGAVPDLAFAAIGQSQEFTPIEMAQYVMTLADRGVKLQPHVLQAIYPADEAPGSPGSKPIYTFKPKVEARLNINPTYMQAALQGMYLMANNPMGLLYQGGFAGSPYHAAGKTGTAQISENGRNVDDSVTIAFAPYNHPQIAIAVMVPGGGASTTTASHIAHRLFNAYFQLHHEFFPKSQWINPQFPANWSSTFAAQQPEKGVMP
ncbi:peptidoglycan D,D-transpeptidase FtsI family protein [Alicyclobacillus tolerans]|uniref:Penicillin-binding protein 2 n=1 Tax=Alicyclobacillus tolerans TaxID=90970 RepID=A0A1M6KY05_9BACL|nr:penicillin-binding transpeptidase domain-containing protein [Alicyclobacillus montanus]SHJ63873.1 penicillin-binding protein 2 [Alicyclobacillus montanus]